MTYQEEAGIVPVQASVQQLLPLIARDPVLLAFFLGVPLIALTLLGLRRVTGDR